MGAGEQVQAGFRIDFSLRDEASLTIQGDAYYGESHADFFEFVPTPPFTSPVDARRLTNGQNILARYSKTLREDSGLQFQLYYDRIKRDDDILEQTQDTIDFDAQHRFSPIENHEVVWGARYRFYTDDTVGSSTVSVNPDSRNASLYSGFIQDEIALSDDLRFIVGTKIEHNHHTDFEYQPSAKFVWRPDERNTLWSAVSRSVRTPSRVNDDLTLPAGVAMLPDGSLAFPTLFGSRSFDSEEIISYEVGYRTYISDNMTLDIATFVNDVDGVLTLETGAPFVDPAGGRAIVPLTFGNNLDGNTVGVEVVVDCRPTDFWRLVGTYSWIDMELHLNSSSNDTTQEAEEDQTPENQFLIRSLLDLPMDLEFDTSLRYSDSIPAFRVDSYTELDLRLGWHPTENLEVSIVGQNLLESKHIEYVSDFIAQDVTEVERGVYGKIRYDF